MAIIVDSGAVYALYDRDDAFHTRVRRAVESARETLILPAPALGEIDYLLRSRLGNPALIRFLQDTHDGAFKVEAPTPDDLKRCGVLIAKYSNLDLGLVDALVVATAERLGANGVLSVDQRDFRAIRTISGKPIVILPFDR